MSTPTWLTSMFAQEQVTPLVDQVARWSGPVLVVISTLVLLWLIIDAWLARGCLIREQQTTRVLTEHLELLQQERDSLAAELSFVRKLLGPGQVSERAELLINGILPNAESGFALVFEATDTGLQLRQTRGLAAPPPHRLTLSATAERMVREQASVVLDTAGRYGQQPVVGLSRADRARADRLVAFRLGNASSPWGAIVTSTLTPGGPLGTLTGVSLVAAWERLAALFGEHLEHSQDYADRVAELSQTREMLDLRAIADREDAQPEYRLRQYLKRLVPLLGFERGSLHLVDQETHELEAVVARAGDEQIPPQLLPAWDQSADGAVARADSFRENWFRGTELEQADVPCPFEQALTIPLIRNNQLLGLLCLTSRHSLALSAPRKELLLWSQSHLAEVIARTLDWADLRWHATRDPLTQLVNRRVFQDALNRAVEQSAQSGLECSLVLLDLDHFKSVNDTHGHAAGDAALKTVGHIVARGAASTRGTDQAIAARLGGEELAILLPGVGLAGAARIAETIRAAVADTPIQHSGHEFFITLSAGLAVCPSQAKSANDLYESADAALYQAKLRGRNRVEATGTNTPNIASES